MMKASELRSIAESILEQIDGWDDDTVIHTRCNTYGMPYTTMEVSDGFIDYTDIRMEDDDDY